MGGADSRAAADIEVAVIGGADSGQRPIRRVTRMIA